MKIRGKIGQIIKWEEKERFFHNINYGDVEVDLIHVGQLPEGKWHDHHIFGLLKSLMGFDKPIFKYENISLDVGNGLPILVERPHTFSVGDGVIVDITVKDGGLFGAEVGE